MLVHAPPPPTYVHRCTPPPPHAHTYTHTNTYTHNTRGTHAHATPAPPHTHTHTHTHMNTYMTIQAYPHPHAHTPKHTNTHTHACPPTHITHARHVPKSIILTRLAFLAVPMRKLSGLMSRWIKLRLCTYSTRDNCNTVFRWVLSACCVQCVSLNSRAALFQGVPRC
jgi:hypothetical protein